MKPHIKVIQRNGVDIFVTSSLVMKTTKADIKGRNSIYAVGSGQLGYGALQKALNPTVYDPRQTSGKFYSYGDHIYQGP